MQTPVTVAVIALILALAVGLAVWLYRRRNASLEFRLKKCSAALLENILVADGDSEGGEIHLEYALLCPRGVVLLNLKDITGNVFGSDSMEEWTVITGKSRYTFANPQHGLYDRLAAVRRLLPDVPVEGHIAFPRSAEFNKGKPAHVIMFDDLIAELQAESAKSEAVDAYWPAWETLKAGARLNSE